jgi:hydroxymethylpyrimidine/phosphomethylpyrimidine kinase
MSIQWGIETALRKNPDADIIYHLGDIGKEAMILVFDRTPSRVVGKVNRILVEYLKNPPKLQGGNCKYIHDL